MAIQIGDKAPELLGTDQDGKEIRLSDFKGKKLSRSISIRKTIRAAVQQKHAACETGIKHCKQQVMK